MLWATMLVTAFFGLGFYGHALRLHRDATRTVAGHVRSPMSHAVDVAFAVAHFGNWLLVLYYKVSLHSLVNLLQPCHLLLLLQGLAVVGNGPAAALAGALTFPMIVGAVMGLLVPATEGLDQPLEYEQVNRITTLCVTHASMSAASHQPPFLALSGQFFVQHWLMIVTGLHLLLRNNRVAYRLMSAKTLGTYPWKGYDAHSNSASFVFTAVDLSLARA